jgi:hypothetical protein
MKEDKASALTDHSSLLSCGYSLPEILLVTEEVRKIKKNRQSTIKSLGNTWNSSFKNVFLKATGGVVSASMTVANTGLKASMTVANTSMNIVGGAVGLAGGAVGLASGAAVTVANGTMNVVTSTAGMVTDSVGLTSRKDRTGDIPVEFGPDVGGGTRRDGGKLRVISFR